MRSSLSTVLLALVVGCSSTPTVIHPLDGKSAVIEGRWNALAKEEGQIVCSTEPKIIDVVGTGGHAVPRPEEMVRVTAVLHWRGMTEKQRKWVEKNAAQGVPDGYIIEWSEATWETLTIKR